MQNSVPLPRAGPFTQGYLYAGVGYGVNNALVVGTSADTVNYSYENVSLNSMHSYSVIPVCVCVRVCVCACLCLCVHACVSACIYSLSSHDVFLRSTSC